MKVAVLWVVCVAVVHGNSLCLRGGRTLLDVRQVMVDLG